MNEKNPQWAIGLCQMRPLFTDSFSVAMKKFRQLAEYVKAESGGIFVFDCNSGTMIQNAQASWEYVFDVIKAAPCFSYVVRLRLPHRLKVKKPNPGLGRAFASYVSKKDAVRLRVYSGKRREDLSGYDGFGREPDELEVVQGLRGRDGSWVKELRLKWK